MELVTVCRSRAPLFFFRKSSLFINKLIFSSLLTQKISAFTLVLSKNEILNYRIFIFLYIFCFLYRSY